MQSEVDTMKDYIEKLRKASQNIMNMHAGYMESLANWESKANKDDEGILLMGTTTSVSTPVECRKHASKCGIPHCCKENGNAANIW